MFLEVSHGLNLLEMKSALLLNIIFFSVKSIWNILPFSACWKSIIGPDVFAHLHWTYLVLQTLNLAALIVELLILPPDSCQQVCDSPLLGLDHILKHIILSIWQCPF